LAYYIPRPKTVTHPGTNRARRTLTSFMRRTPLTTTPRRHPWHVCHSERASMSNKVDNASQQSTCCVTKFSSSRVLQQSSRGKCPYFGDTLISLQHSDGYVEVTVSLHAKTRRKCPAVSLELRLVTDTQKDGWLGNRRSGVALAMRHRHQCLSTYGLTAYGRAMSSPPIHSASGRLWHSFFSSNAELVMLVGCRGVRD